MRYKNIGPSISKKESVPREKISPITIEEHYGFPAGSFRKFIERQNERGES